MKTKDKIRCECCNKKIIEPHHRQKYCPECALEIKRKKAREYANQKKNMTQHQEKENKQLEFLDDCEIIIIITYLLEGCTAEDIVQKTGKDINIIKKRIIDIKNQNLLQRYLQIRKSFQDSFESHQFYRALAKKIVDPYEEIIIMNIAGYEPSKIIEKCSIKNPLEVKKIMELIYERQLIKKYLAYQKLGLNNEDKTYSLFLEISS